MISVVRGRAIQVSVLASTLPALRNIALAPVDSEKIFRSGGRGLSGGEE